MLLAFCHTLRVLRSRMSGASCDCHNSGLYVGVISGPTCRCRASQRRPGPAVPRKGKMCGFQAFSVVSRIPSRRHFFSLSHHLSLRWSALMQHRAQHSNVRACQLPEVLRPPSLLPALAQAEPDNRELSTCLLESHRWAKFAIF